MTPTANDYAWLAHSQWFGRCDQDGYSLTLVRGRTPQQVLEAIGAVPQGFGDGFDDLLDCHEELREWVDDYQDDSFAAAAVTVPGEGGDWTLLLALDSGVGISGHLPALSAGGVTVTHDSNAGKPMQRFTHYRDGEVLTSFEEPERSHGSAPGALGPLLREVGYDGSGKQAAFFALAERLTGVRIIDETVRDAEFLLGVVADEEEEGTD
ncbi:DUF6461 domain-containing protein [Kitasatospora sp. NPDC004614]|uniref:DUF6461 domain-containing protein n=1 Tax=unclassified Kitasatospora TaxID=2633591 RepID=UPI0036D1943B